LPKTADGRVEKLRAGSDSVSIIEENRIKILIIDRHEAVRRALRIRLSAPAQLEVVGVAVDPDEALDQIGSSRPDVIIFGLQNGSDEDLFQTTIAIRDMVKETPIVIVLAPYVDTVERELLLQAGAKRYLLKHINSMNLIHEIELAASHKPLV
jgi:DNA-binding NarL/FixJ family response regulator